MSDRTDRTIEDRVEILAPVGGRAQLLAAVRAGANAVYLGGKGFNARRNAENFGNERNAKESGEEFTLREAVEYAHARNVKVYVTVNTIVGDDELDGVREAIADVAESGADAVIIQDLAVAKIVREEYPTLAMHASTQMAAHDLEGIRLLGELGFDRAVLARELSLDEIRTVAKGTKLDLESFVHGAHCMSLSGGCYLSSMIGGRSGNRGLCAQPCRLDFNCKGRGYALSLKDMCYLDHVRELADAGVCSFKIEGRMKRPEYVAGAVNAYRGGTVKKETLRAVFSRSGFTDGFLTGRRDVSMFGNRTKEDVTAASDVLSELAGLYRSETPAVPVDLTLTAGIGMETVLTATDGERWVTVTGRAAERAERVPLTKASVRKALEKTGGTPFLLRELDCVFLEEGAETGLSLPAAELNRMRREALDRLLAERSRIVPHRHVEPKAEPDLFRPHAAPAEPALRLRFETAAQYERVLGRAKDPSRYTAILPLRVLLEHPGILSGARCPVIGELPSLHFPADDPKLEADLGALAANGLTDVLAEDPGGIRIGRRAGLAVHGGANLNIMNSVALSEYERLGLADATVTFEASAARIRKLGGTLPRGMLAYGYLPLMKMRACPARTKDGCRGCSGITPMVDRKGETFTVICRGKRYSELLNCVPLYIADKPVPPVDFLTLYFTIESPDAAAAVTAAFESKQTPVFRRTNGLYWRELL